MSDPAAERELNNLGERLAGICLAGDYHQARQAVADLLAQNTSGRVLRLVARQAKRHSSAFPDLTRAKIAVLSSYSAEFLDDALIVACFLKGVVPELYQPAFNQFRQEILDPGSGLYPLRRTRSSCRCWARTCVLRSTNASPPMRQCASRRWLPSSKG